MLDQVSFINLHRLSTDNRSTAEFAKSQVALATAFEYWPYRIFQSKKCKRAGDRIPAAILKFRSFRLTDLMSTPIEVEQK